ncbi:hypothetical protein K504DRAFT_456866 [Pleomassaria siparia CBS 279.74]|uniref:U3 snoRNA associated n=1 Tax=Pleomassaria siparia CBS 279.74 TaxID=1314801 RepID=A0A6G1KP96_9PLEO|nr:hypothetical protein K504DRAFT_456866 [Pleomassaria siparia CBS 279.74]
MFTRVFNTAKRVFSRSPSVQIPSAESREPTPNTHDLDITMVSTRSGADVTPRSDPRKGKRGLEAGDTPLLSRKRRKSVGTQEKGNVDVEAAEAEDVDTETPVQADDTPASTNKEKLPIRRRTNPMVVINTTPAGSSLANATTLASPKDQTGSPTYPSSKKRTRKQGGSPEVTGAPSPEPSASEKTSTATVEVEVPVDSLQESSKALATPKSKSKKKSKGTNVSTPAATVPRVSRFPEEIPSSTYESEQAAIPSQEPSPASFKAKEATPRSSQKKTKKSASSVGDENKPSKHESEQVVSPSREPAPMSSTKAKKEHIRFDGEGHADASVAMALEALEPQPTPIDDDSDSDEAPEEVTTAFGLRQAKAAEEDALRAQKALQEKEKLKRQQRADRIKQEQGVKQKKAEKKAAKLAKQRAREKLLEPAEEELDVDIHNLPALLPESFLEAAGDMRPPTPPPQRHGRTAEEARLEKLSRHTKFLERGEKPIKDVKKGSLNVHVLAQQNMLLAPKVNRATKNIREKWLKGRQAEKKPNNRRMQKMQFRKVERRAVGGGFLKSEE